MAITFIPRPDGMKWQEWVDNFVGYNRSTINRCSPSQDWREFADTLAQTESTVPYAEDFPTWQEWVDSMKQAYGL